MRGEHDEMVIASDDGREFLDVAGARLKVEDRRWQKLMPEAARKAEDALVAL